MLFEKTYEDPIMVATTSITLTQATTINISIMNEKVMEAESKNQKLKDELNNSRLEMKKRLMIT